MPNMLGAYGEWAASLVPDPPRLSFRRPEFKDVNSWSRQARERFRVSLLQPSLGPMTRPEVQKTFTYDGLHIEHLQWQLPYGPPVEAVVLRPEGARGRLPAVLGLHDHGGNKFFGWRKIVRTSPDVHPMMQKHHEHYYGGAAWANEVAKRGYVVMVHDAFAFASRRVRIDDVPPQIRGGVAEPNAGSEEEIAQYNRFAGNHEHVVAKSLFSAGTTWPGVFVGEDVRALDYLCARPDVDPGKVGVCGLSGGGLRTVFLTGFDARVRCSCCVGMMSTWRDYLLQKSYTHTWMCYVPGLPRDLDYPEILGLNLPHPVMVLNNRADALFSMPEMERADAILAAVYKKAGLPDRYSCKFYDGPHKFDREMQADAFTWFDRWLKS